MFRPRPRGEARLYPAVARFLKRRFSAFVTAPNAGTEFGRVDVAGIRDLGGDLGGETEVLAVEVKRRPSNFLAAIGQAYAYCVCAERCYLAVRFPKGDFFFPTEIDIASALGVGLLAIRSRNHVTEILASAPHRPLGWLRRRLVERLGYSPCTVCGALFERTEDKRRRRRPRPNRISTRLKTAMRDEKAFQYFLDEVDYRKKLPGKLIRDRRYVCVDCVKELLEKIPEAARARNPQGHA